VAPTLRSASVAGTRRADLKVSATSGISHLNATSRSAVEWAARTVDWPLLSDHAPAVPAASLCRPALACAHTAVGLRRGSVSASWPLPAVYCFLLSAFCLLPSAHCLRLPTLPTDTSGYASTAALPRITQKPRT
jgi:hypothetical protein